VPDQFVAAAASIPATQLSDKESAVPNYLFSYRVPAGYVRGGPEVTHAWRAWFEEMSTQLIDAGKPISESTALGHCGADARPGGYSVVGADSLEDALTLAKGCPSLADGGGVEVGELAPFSL
jgi:hypothetical protein